MPSLSTFYGLIIWMYSERGGQHNKPHELYDLSIPVQTEKTA